MTPSRWEQINILYLATLELESAERGAFLEAHCGQDEELLREVKELLAHHEKAGSFMEAPALDVAARNLAQFRERTLSGKSLGPYAILSVLGTGGMGEVYLARDTRLGRQVALKVLPPEVAQDPDRLNRFLQEARSASALNHPHIATIYEIGETREIPWFAMEHVEGQTLEHRIAAADIPLQIDAILDIAIQVADALAEAHRQRIIHRDIKSANLMLTPRGQMKVLDFGLAKWLQQEQTLASAEPQTTPGLVIGTVDFMSPEQLLGQDVDHRTDLFSLGVVLYHMVTGRLPFSGISKTDTIGRILHSQPESMAHFRNNVPAGLERIVRRCLEKDRELRYRDASEVSADLMHLKRGDPGVLAAEVRIAKPRRSLWPGATLLLTVAVVGAGLWFVIARNDTPEAPLVPVPLTTYAGDEVEPSFSPDGNQVAFVWDGERDDSPNIYVKRVGREFRRRLTTNPNRDDYPVWSPDGQSIAFLRVFGHGRTALMIIPSDGGSERQVAELSTVRTDAVGGEGMCWHPGGKWLAVACDQESADVPYGIFLVSAETGEKRRLTSPHGGFQGDDSPAFSPNGRYLAFDRFTDSQGEIYLLPVSAALLPEGEPRQLTFDNRYSCYPAWTPNSKEIIYSSGNARINSSLWRIDPFGSGKPSRLAFGGGGSAALYPAVSRQDHRLAYTERAIDVDIWRSRIEVGKEKPAPPSKFIASTRIKQFAQYSPDGTAIAYVSMDSGSAEIWLCDTDGGRRMPLTHLGGPTPVSLRWSPDSRQIVFSLLSGTQHDICSISAQGGEPTRLTHTSCDVGWPCYSKDGRWIYFGSNRGGDYQVWKMPAGGGEAIQLTKTGGTNPVESWDGGSVYYLKNAQPDVGPDADLWRVPVQGGSETRILGPVLRGDFAVLDRGLIFVSRRTPAGFPVMYFEFATGQMKQVSLIDGSSLLIGSSLTASPDQRWILYSIRTNPRADIMLVENFR